MKTPEKDAKIYEESLRRLVQQLALWARDFITGGRSPFRRVETFPSFLTREGDVTAPLVFWINRDSYMAGGVVFFPPPDNASPLHHGALCAESLGLDYYVCWRDSGITLWQRCRETWSAVKQLPVGRGTAPGTVDLHEALLALMEEMKTFSVLGAAPPGNLSPYYLANLTRATLLSLLPVLTEHYRIHRGLTETERCTLSAERQALGKATVTLTRVLALALHDALPKAVQPQTLEVVVNGTLGELPEPLPQTLRMYPDEIALPEEALVRLHLLLHRLTQLGIARHPQGATKALEILQKYTGLELGGHPLPAPPAPANGPVLLLHPDHVPAGDMPQMMVASSPMLALRSLLRHLYRQPPFLVCATDVMGLLPEPVPGAVCGTLVDGRLPSVGERQSLAARLRLSWPARRFRLPPRTPLWAWQLLHLLGLGTGGTRFDILTPPRWLASVYGRQLLALILESASISRLQETGQGLWLRFCKGENPDSPIEVIHDSQVRGIQGARLHREHISLLPMALSLTSDVWDMIDDGRLAVPTPRSWQTLPGEGVFLFVRSSLGRYLWHVTGGGRPLPRRAALRTEILRQGLPLPGQKILNALQQLQADGAGEVSPSLLDHELTRWLGPLPEFPETAKSGEARTGDKQEGHLPEHDLIDAIDELVFMDGIPVFPDHYLYDYYRPELRLYTFEAPLTIGGEFFGTIEMQDAKGETFQVEGAETAQALELISSLGTGSVKLPLDRSITAAILDRYRQDLRKLRGNLVKEVFRRQADPQSAKALVEQLWQKQALPPWPLLSHG
jgi:hypothetical protein